MTEIEPPELARERRLRQQLEAKLNAERTKSREALAQLAFLRQQGDAAVKRSTNRLHLRAEQLQRVVAGLPVGVLAEDGFRQVIAANQRFMDLFHVPGDPNKLVGSDGSNMHQSAAPMFLDPNFAARVDALTRAQKSCKEERLALLDGRELLRSYQPLVEGNTCYHLWTYREAQPEGARQSELMKAKAAAEEANAAKTRFLAMMSHEMRTPLSVIIGMTELLFDEAQLTSTQRDYMSRVLRNAESLRALIEDILQFSKLQAGAIQLRESSFSPARLAREVCEALQVRADEKNLQLSHRSFEVPERVHGDEQRLRQVLVNLVGNAIKFTESGSVNLVLQCIQQEPLRIRYVVLDTGIGVPKNMQRRIFERFVRVETGENLSRVSGTGLGLSITHALVQLMGGQDIELISHPDKGSEFSFVLDHGLADDAPPPSDLIEPEQLNRGRSRRVLLAEDDPDSRLLLERRLRRLGYQVEAAGDGATALERAKLGRYDALVADLSMPVLDGIALTHKLRSWEKKVGASPVPIVMLTAHALPTFREQALAAGIDDYISKPVRTQTLRRHLKQLLKQNPSVLVVDDDEAFVALVRATFRRAKLEVIVAPDGATALATARLHRIDLVLLDQSLPDATGETVAAQLRQLPGMTQVPLIAVTGHHEEHVHANLRQAGCKEVLLKPIQRGQLRSVVERFLRQEDDQDSAPAGIQVAVDEDVAALMPRYLTRRREDIHKLRAHLRSQEFQQLETMGHQMKGSGAAYGLQAVSDYGAAIEAGAQRHDCIDIKTSIDALDDFLRRVAITRSIPLPRP